MKILIVDDDENIRAMYADVFKQEGFIVSEAADGMAGLDKAKNELPDVVFTGIIMPRMDGFALKDALAKNAATSKIPVVMSSHMGREEDREKANQMGIKEFIVLGMNNPHQVVEKISSIFGNSTYTINVSVSGPDAARLAGDFHMNPKFRCVNCDKDLALLLKTSNINNHEFTAKFVCPDCDK